MSWLNVLLDISLGVAGGLFTIGVIGLVYACVRAIWVESEDGRNRRFLQRHDAYPDHWVSSRELRELRERVTRLREQFAELRRADPRHVALLEHELKIRDTSGAPVQHVRNCAICDGRTRVLSCDNNFIPPGQLRRSVSDSVARGTCHTVLHDGYVIQLLCCPHTDEEINS